MSWVKKKHTMPATTQCTKSNDPTVKAVWEMMARSKVDHDRAKQFRRSNITAAKSHAHNAIKHMVKAAEYAQEHLTSDEQWQHVLSTQEHFSPVLFRCMQHALESKTAKERGLKAGANGEGVEEAKAAKATAEADKDDYADDNFEAECNNTEECDDPMHICKDSKCVLHEEQVEIPEELPPHPCVEQKGPEQLTCIAKNLSDEEKQTLKSSLPVQTLKSMVVEAEARDLKKARKALAEEAASLGRTFSTLSRPCESFKGKDTCPSPDCSWEEREGCKKNFADVLTGHKTSRDRTQEQYKELADKDALRMEAFKEEAKKKKRKALAEEAASLGRTFSTLSRPCESFKGKDTCPSPDCSWEEREGCKKNFADVLTGHKTSRDRTQEQYKELADKDALRMEAFEEEAKKKKPPPSPVLGERPSTPPPLPPDCKEKFDVTKKCDEDKKCAKEMVKRGPDEKNNIDDIFAVQGWLSRCEAAAKLKQKREAKEARKALEEEPASTGETKTGEGRGAASEEELIGGTALAAMHAGDQTPESVLAEWKRALSALGAPSSAPATDIESFRSGTELHWSDLRGGGNAVEGDLLRLSDMVPSEIDEEESMVMEFDLRSEVPSFW